MSKSFSYDETDLAIVEQLRRNGRASNQQIATQLDLSAATVSTRIRRMEDADQLRIVAVSDFSARGYNVLMRVWVEVDGRQASAVAQELAELSEVAAVHLVTGRYDIDILVALQDFDDLSDFILQKISRIRGIHSFTPAIVVDIISYSFEVAPIKSRE